MNTPPGAVPRVDVIVPAYNAARTLGACLDALCGQEGGFSLRVLVVDDGSNDNTTAIATAQSRCTVLRLPENKGIGAARNAGLACAEADYIGFCDSDVIVQPGWLAALLEVLEKRADGACGYVLPRERHTDFYHYCDARETKRAFRNLSGPLPFPQYQILPFNYVFRRSVFYRIGPFDERFSSNAEDTDFLYRCAQAGLSIHLVRKAQALHDYQVQDAHAFARKLRRVGREGLRFHLKWRTGYLWPKVGIACTAITLSWAYYLVTFLFGIDEAHSKTRLRRGRPVAMLAWEWRLYTRYFKALGEAQMLAHALVDRSLWDKETKCTQPLPFWSGSRSLT